MQSSQLLAGVNLRELAPAFGLIGTTKLMICHAAAL
jgi:hypothetical protein